MLKHQIVLKILFLLKEKKYSQRKIAKMLGVSRGTVSAIALGKRKFIRSLLAREDATFIPPQGPYCRCSTCGAKTKMPCLACQLRGKMRKLDKKIK